MLLDANGGNVDENTVSVILGEKYSSLPTPQRDNYYFEGWYTSAVGGSKITEKTYVTDPVPEMLYAHWNQTTVQVSLDANGGSLDNNTVSVTLGDKHGSLPIPQRDYYSFIGWYTSDVGGNKITEQSEVDEPIPDTLYAHWQQNDISGWVLSSEVPAGASIVDQKWKYTLTESKETTNSSESGWSQVGSYWKQTSSGTNTYGQFPTNSGGYEYYNTSDRYYKAYNGSPLQNTETSDYKREISNEQVTSYVYYHWVYPLSGNHSETDRIVGEYNGEWINNGGYANIWESFEGEYIEYNSQINAYEARGHSTYSYWWNGRIPIYTQTYTDYEMIYQYKRDIPKESSTEISAGGSIYNVQKYVRYRPR